MKIRTALLLSLALVIALPGLSFAQLQIKGSIAGAEKISIFLVTEGGSVKRIGVKGKNHRFRFAIEESNTSQFLTVRSQTRTQIVQIFTHCDPSEFKDQKLALKLSMGVEEPLESIVYYSINQLKFVHQKSISSADEQRLFENNFVLRPVKTAKLTLRRADGEIDNP